MRPEAECPTIIGQEATIRIARPFRWRWNAGGPVTEAISKKVKMMSVEKRNAVYLRLPKIIRDPLVADAKKQKCSLQHVLQKIAAQHYGVVDFEPDGIGQKVNAKK